MLFVFEDEDPATYHNLAYELKDWRIKRITYANLRRFAKQFRFLINGHNAETREDGCHMRSKGMEIIRRNEFARPVAADGLYPLVDCQFRAL